MPLRRNRRQYEQLSDFERGRTSRHLGRSYVVVARSWQQWITEGIVCRRGGSGRPRNTNAHEDGAIIRKATSVPTTSLESIRRHLPPSRHPVVSRESTENGTKYCLHRCHGEGESSRHNYVMVTPLFCG
ncbi:hypothetical protein AVEN_269457-1 [Araneus ventricosus]|uniref:Uncharacterized protein n=1 Tax=Araneus ventricosus TaxID=182803 RepID=A0A4Y2NUK7_ARAVE|nr:hypothetical protein AVEN_269457-1 [Araneus ventricosus]